MLFVIGLKTCLPQASSHSTNGGIKKKLFPLVMTVGSHQPVPNFALLIKDISCSTGFLF